MWGMVGFTVGFLEFWGPVAGFEGGGSAGFEGGVFVDAEVRFWGIGGWGFALAGPFPLGPPVRLRLLGSRGPESLTRALDLFFAGPSPSRTAVSWMEFWLVLDLVPMEIAKAGSSISSPVS